MLSKRLLATALVAASLPSVGCLYLDGINQRPGIEIVRLNPGPVYRGLEVALEAVVSDPDGHDVELVWRAFACADDVCDPAGDGAARRFNVRVPTDRPVALVRVTLEARDSRGALARPAQELVLDVRDLDPEVKDLTVHDPERWIVGQKVTACARHVDRDDPPTAGLLRWTVTDPSGRDLDEAVLEPVSTTLEPDAVVECKAFVAAARGTWRVVAAVRAKPAIYADEDVAIADDDAPCLDLSSPAPGRLLLDAPRRLSVLRVKDALDPFPAKPGSGAARFTWSLRLASEATRRPLPGATASYLELDPLSFSVGEQLEVRVEVADRRGLVPACPDGEPTCSAAPGCTQRQTWILEVR